MVWVLGIGCRGNNSIAMDHGGKFGPENRCSVRGGARPMPGKFGHQSRSLAQKGRITVATMTTAAEATTGLKNQMSLEPYRTCGSSGEGKDAVDGLDRIHKWMRNSIREIVKNLKDAPLLVQVYSNRNSEGGETTTLLMTEGEKGWAGVKEKWRAGEAALPEGVILVEELGGDGEKGGEERTTKVWGIVVQGRGVGCGPVCYLLKTTSVASGTGILCTHLCLIRVKDIRESVESQFGNIWRAQSQFQ